MKAGSGIRHGKKKGRCRRRRLARCKACKACGLMVNPLQELGQNNTCVTVLTGFAVLYREREFGKA